MCLTLTMSGKAVDKTLVFKFRFTIGIYFHKEKALCPLNALSLAHPGTTERQGRSPGNAWFEAGFLWKCPSFSLLEGKGGFSSWGCSGWPFSCPNLGSGDCCPQNGTSLFTDVCKATRVPGLRASAQAVTRAGVKAPWLDAHRDLSPWFSLDTYVFIWSETQQGNVCY